MNLQQLFYLLASIYFLLSLIFIIALAAGVFVLIKRVQTIKAQMEAKLKSPANLARIIPMAIPVFSFLFRRRRNKA